MKLIADLILENGRVTTLDPKHPEAKEVVIADGRIAGIDHHGLIAAFLHHILDQATLYGIIVGDQNAGSHGFPRNATLSVSNRGTLADAD